MIVMMHNVFCFELRSWVYEEVGCEISCKVVKNPGERRTLANGDRPCRHSRTPAKIEVIRNEAGNAFANTV